MEKLLFELIDPNAKYMLFTKNLRANKAAGPKLVRGVEVIQLLYYYDGEQYDLVYALNKSNMDLVFMATKVTPEAWESITIIATPKD